MMHKDIIRYIIRQNRSHNIEPRFLSNKTDEEFGKQCFSSFFTFLFSRESIVDFDTPKDALDYIKIHFKGRAKTDKMVCRLVYNHKTYNVNVIDIASPEKIRP